MPDFSAHPLTPATWDAYAALIEAHRGVWGGCWCLAFHPEGLNNRHTPTERRALKQARVDAGTAHAALVFDGKACVGWCQFGPTATLPRIKNRNAYDKAAAPLPAPILPDWRITCFFVGSTHRHQGVAALALSGALIQITALGGGTVASFKAHGFTRLRPIGKTRWVVGRVL